MEGSAKGGAEPETGVATEVGELGSVRSMYAKRSIATGSGEVLVGEAIRVPQGSSTWGIRDRKCSRCLNI